MNIDVNAANQRRRHAHLAAVTIGLVVGIPFFLGGLKGVFTIGGSDTWLTITTGFTGWLALLPLTLLGFIKPRAAARGLIACLSVFVAGLLACAMSYPASMEFTLNSTFRLVLFFVAPPAVVARLFFYTSAGDAHKVEGNC